MYMYMSSISKFLQRLSPRRTLAQQMHCTNKHGGFRDPHCAEPYVVDAKSIVKSLSADSDNDTSLALNIITDPCPELTKNQLHTMTGFESCPLFLFPFFSLLSSLFSLLSSLFSLLSSLFSLPLSLPLSLLFSSLLFSSLLFSSLLFSSLLFSSLLFSSLISVAVVVWCVVLCCGLCGVCGVCGVCDVFGETR